MPHVYRKINEYAPEDREARRALLNERKKRNRARQSPEHRELIRQRDAERKRRARAAETPEQRAADRDRKRAARKLEARLRARHPELF